MSRIPWFIILVVFSCSVLVVNPAAAQNSLNLNCIQQYYHDWVDGSYDVAALDGYAYLACGTEGVHVLDISDMNNIRDVARIADVHATTIAAGGQRLYLGSNLEGIHVFDISDPLHPVALDLIEMRDCTFFSFRIQDRFLCVCGISDNGHGLSFIDIGNNDVFDLLWSSENLANAYDIEIVHPLAYVGSGDRLLTFDVSDMTSPQLVDSFESGNYGNLVLGVDVSGGYAYLANGDAGFRVFDLTAKQVVAEIHDLDPLVFTDIDYPIAVRVVDSLAFVHYNIYDCPLAVINIADPLNPVVLSNYYPPENISKFIIDGSRALIADQTAGMRVIDVSNPLHLVETHSFDDCEQDIEIVGMNNGIAYVRQECRLVAIDVSNSAQPQERDAFRWNNPSSPPYWYNPRIFQVEIVGSTGFMVCGDEYSPGKYLYSLDLSDPDHIAVMDSFVMDDCGRFLYADSHIYLWSDASFIIFDVSDPLNIFYEEQTAADFPNFVSISDGYILRSTGSGWAYCSVEDVREPVWSGSFSWTGLGGSFQAARIVDDRLYIATTTCLAIYALDTRQRLSLTTIVEDDEDYTKWVTGFKVIDNVAYVSVYGTGVELYDVSNPEAVERIGYYESSLSASDLEVQGSMIYVAAESHFAMYSSVIPTAVEPDRDLNPQTVALHPNYPNPFNATTTIAFDLPESGQMSLAIFNTLGQHVATLADGFHPAGQYHLQWNGCLSSGVNAASGIYIYRLQIGQTIISQRMTLLK